MNVYNGAEFLKDSIGSVLRQTLQNFVLLIYDDGSTDNTVEVVKSFHDERIKLVEGGENKGVLYSRAQMIPMIETEYFMLLDDDDFFCRDDAFETALNLAKSGDYDIVNIPTIHFILSDGREMDINNGQKYEFEYHGDMFFRYHYPVSFHHLFVSKIIRTSIAKRSIPEEEITSRRFAADDVFFGSMMLFLTKKYFHAASQAPIYAYHSDIGVWGSRNNDFSPERINELCDLEYHVLLSLYRRMTAIRPLSPMELLKLVGGVDIAEVQNRIRSVKDRYKFNELKNVWYKWFCADGVHLLNGVDEFALPDYVRWLNERMN